MSLLEQIVLAWVALVRTLRELPRARLWAPWAVMGLVEVAVLACLWWFAYPLLSWIMAPVLQWIAGPQVLRYPNLFRLLPTIFGRADLVVGAVLGSVMIGAATLLFAQRFRGGRTAPGQALGAAFRRAPALIVVNLPFNLLVLGLSYGIAWMLADRESGTLVRRLGYVATLLGSIGVQALFLYVSAILMLEGRGVVDSFAQLPRTWARGFWAALFLGGVMLLPILPIHYLSGRSSLFVDRGSPEMVGWLVFVQIGLSLLSWFLLAGSATLVYLSALAPEHERGVA